jgi:hypothetical protein
MSEAKGFNAHDGTAFSMLRLGGIKTGLITKRISDTVARFENRSPYTKEFRTSSRASKVFSSRKISMPPKQLLSAMM